MAEEFTINKAYAEKYNKWRQKEELQKLKDKYGDVSDGDTGSSSSETEDEEAEALTSQIEKDWLRTLSALKSKDPKIYKKDFQFYNTKEDSGKETGKKTKQKPVFLKDYERKLILEKEGHLSEESDSNEESEIQDNTPGYYEEQEQIKKSFKSALDSEEDSDDTDLFTKRSKSKEEKEKEEEEYLKWLKGQKKELKDEQNYGIDLESLKSYWSDPKLDDGEKFLRDYILNKGYLDRDSDRIPTYDEIVDDGEGFSEEETILDKQEEFERKYNFRFEEPDQEFIKSYPRTISDTVRRKDSKRAEKRKEIKERKKQKYFESNYYETEVEDKKPVFSDDEELDIEDWDKWEGEKYGEDDYSKVKTMDADYDPNEEVTTKKGKKRKSTFARALKKKKPVFDPAQKTFEEYFDEYYKLDYEDLAGDVPCRFKYRKVTANDYGLSTNEVRVHWAYAYILYLSAISVVIVQETGDRIEHTFITCYTKCCGREIFQYFKM
ncbi:hypothetical protein KUTeg_015823 [Tegillarca granosa]|uniref:Protein KRI1 homolog n=1 Tax=Tegillarca granosa TaxID=220873 RepID=A0ABQ9EPU2_TEGGR|nr:hypothetical protein KUTeg_015823 [Tegillarca granosa]